MPTVRTYRAEDLPALTGIFHRAVHAVPDELYSLGQRELWAPSPPDPSRWAERFAAAPPEVAVEDGSIAGFMTLEPDGHIDMAYVDPVRQGRGIARALMARVEQRAAELRLGRLFSEVSHAARPFFERCGFRVVRPNEVTRDGQTLSNWIMDRRLVSPAARGRIFVTGSSGAGKTTLACALARQLDRAHVDLDEVAFLDHQGTRREVSESIVMLRERPGLEGAIVEGCYADLIEGLATPSDHLIWLDLTVHDCLANARSRP